jgi:serine/threonine-protein kinase PpkA
MTTILIVEDDDAIRNNVTRLLKLEGYTIGTAVNGREGLARARMMRPDLVITDIGMPEMDGFALLEAIRADAALAGTSVMMLTALDDRASMRRGMTAGADDYLAKPFTRVELLEALQGLLKKRGRVEQTVQQAVAEREALLRRAFTDSLGGAAPSSQFGLEPPAGAVPDEVLQATVLFSDIRGFTSLAEKLDSREVAELLTRYFERVCQPVLQNGGRHLKFIGDGLMAVFSDALAGSSPLPAQRRAVSAALGMALAAHDFRAWIEQRFAARGLPPFAVGIGLHAGEVTICRLGAPGNTETTPIGDTVNTAARLESASKELGWTVVASSAVLAAAGEGVQTGGMTSLEVRGRNGFVDVAEIVGLVTNLQDKQHGMATLTERADDVREAVQANSEITARAVKGALQSKLNQFKQFEEGGEPPRLKGYRLQKKIGAGGMTEVYLARRESDALPVVLKVLDASGRAATEHLSRFIQEYALLSRIAHPNVVRIYDQGFTDDHAYIAMEYFARGDLRRELGEGPMSQQRVVSVIVQVAQALAAIHERGVIHRDLKPENVMRREGDSVALADFGIAKSMLQTENLALAQTRHGDVVGTPYYLSPEQAAGGAVTPASDLYSLGVTFFELLAGRRPYMADSLEALLALHRDAPTPALPAEHARLQPIVDRLMAKQTQDRPESAQALLWALQTL